MQNKAKFVSMSLALTVAGMLAIGCQATAPIMAENPSMNVVYGTLRVPTTAPLAIALDVRPLLAAASKRQLMAAIASPSPSPTGAGPATHIVVTVSGGGLAKPYTVDLPLTDCTDGMAVITVPHIPPGTNYTVVATAEDANDTPVAASSVNNVSVGAGATTEVDMTCEPADGAIGIHWNCTATCGASPTPSPTATPTPPPPADPSEQLSNVSGLAVDGQGNVYLSGLDPNYSSEDYHVAARIIKVNANATVDSTPVYDNVQNTADMAVIGDTLYYYNVFQGAFAVDLPTKTLQVSPSQSSFFGWGLTKTPQNDVIWTEYGTSQFWKNPASPTAVSVVAPAPYGTDYYMVNVLSYNNGNGNLIWTAPTGIYEQTDTSGNHAQLLASSHDNEFYGFSATADDTKFLVTSPTDHTISLYDRTANTVASALSPAPSLAPEYVQAGPNNTYYVLYFNTAAFRDGQSIPYSTQYQVVKYDLVGGQLVNPVTMVDTLH